LEYGRQVLGEVPGLFFLVAGLALWLETWESSSARRLVAVGLLFGLAVVTKNQYLLVIAPAVAAAWLINLVYWKAPQRLFVLPGVLAVACYGVWQGYTVLYLGPATALENLTLLRDATAGAALVFSPSQMRMALQDLLAFKVFLGLLLPVLAYGLTLAVRRDRVSELWGLIYLLIAVNLGWYVVASIGWPRYAFPGLALAALFVAKLFCDLTGGFHWDYAAVRQALRLGDASLPRETLRGVAWASLAVMILLPLAQTARSIIAPPFDGPDAMAAYLNQNVPTNAIIETWEPEMGFLTNHNYHFPPAALLNNAVAYIWLNGQPPAQLYDFTKPVPPPYVLVGTFGRWVGLYPEQQLTTRYQLLTRIGDYELYELRPAAP